MRINKKTYYMVGVAVVIALVFFYVGMQYGKSSSQPVAGNGYQGSGQGRSAGGGGMRTNGGGFSGGEVLSKDQNSITIKTRNGGSSIVFYSSSTQVSKSASGTLDDVAVGSQITISGTPNPDGSLTAQSIQVR